MRVRVCSVLVVMLVLLAACGGAGEEPGASTDPDGETAATSILTSTDTPSPTATAQPSPSPTASLPLHPIKAVPAPASEIATGGIHTDPRWTGALRTGDGATLGRVADALNVRSAPRLDAPVVGITYPPHLVSVYDLVEGDPIDNSPIWYRIGPDRYVSADFVEPFIPAPPSATHAGHWLDVDLTNFTAVAYDGTTPVYAAVIIAGTDRSTPTGTYEILMRVANETMDAATVGIAKGSPGYYYLPNVKYTQYFKAGGYALHSNYWSDPAAFGREGSHGCINLLEADAAWLWDFLSIGSTVVIHG